MGFPAYAKSFESSGSPKNTPELSSVERDVHASSDDVLDPSDWLKNSSFTPILGKVIFEGSKDDGRKSESDHEGEETPKKKLRKSDSEENESERRSRRNDKTK